MNTYPNINYQFRPASYWDDESVLASLLRNVKGTKRRKMIEQAWREARLERLPAELLQDTLTEEQRVSLGRIHPAFMGGEYLPDYDSEEIEIARIELNSTTADVISIRAQHRGQSIWYRIVDEYGTKFEQQLEKSDEPLTLEELIRLIDDSNQPDYSGGLALCFNVMNAEFESDPESLRQFTTVRSKIYPQLEEHYDHVYEEWGNES